MSKNFEKEYNEMLDSQIPDLWSRIEPQLEDKTSTDTTIKNSRKPNKFARVIPFIGSALAACLLIGIAIPFGINMKNMNSSETATATSSAFYEDVIKDNSVSECAEATDSVCTDEISDSTCAEQETNSSGVKDITSNQIVYNVTDNIIISLPEKYNDLDGKENIIVYTPVTSETKEEYDNKIFIQTLEDEDYYSLYLDYSDYSFIPDNEDEIGCVISLPVSVFSEEDIEAIFDNIVFLNN